MVSMQKVLIAAIFASSFSSAAFAQDQCEFRYSTQLSKRAAKISATVSAEALRAISNDLATAVGQKQPNATINYQYSISAAGGVAQEAYNDTITRGFLCTLEEKFKNDPTKSEAIINAGTEFILKLDSFFDYSTWNGPESLKRRDQLKSEIQAMPTTAGPLSSTDAQAGLPNVVFDTAKIKSLTAEVAVPGLATGDACYGVVESSIRKVSPDVLANLGLIRPILIKYMSGNQKQAMLQAWALVSSAMNKQFAPANQATTIPATDAMLLCVNKAKAAAEAQEAKVVVEDLAKKPIP